MESVSWKHSVPTTMSWFQGQNPFLQSHQSFLNASRNANPVKRKSPFFDDSPLPPKQYVSEEAMAAHMHQLHIGNNYMISQADSNTSPIEIVNNLEELDIKEYDSSIRNESMKFDACLAIEAPKLDTPASQIVISPEVMSIKPEPILPKSILDNLRKPSMELVLWKPPVGLVDSLIRNALASDDNKDKNYENYKQSKQDMLHNNLISQFSDKQDSSMHKPFQLYRVVPAMTPQEIERLDEDMNMI